MTEAEAAKIVQEAQKLLNQAHQMMLDAGFIDDEELPSVRYELNHSMSEKDGSFFTGSFLYAFGCPETKAKILVETNRYAILIAEEGEEMNVGTFENNCEVY